MVDRGAVLPVDFAGGGAGLACARWGRKTGPDLSRTKQFSAAGDFSLQPLSGTQPLSWEIARSRSTGMLQKHSVIDDPLKSRTETGFDFLVEVLVRAMPKKRQEDLRQFSRPFHPARERGADLVPEDNRRKVVWRVMQQYPLTDIYDLARCSPDRWSQISRDLGGITHTDAMAHASEYLKTVAPINRASFWTSTGPQHRPVDLKGACNFAGLRR